MTLYELTGQWLELQQMIESGEFEDEILADTLEGLDGEIEEKADAYARIVRNLEADVKAYKDEEQRFYQKRKAAEHAIDRLKNNLYTAMVAMGKTKIDNDLFKIAIQKNGGALPVILDVDEEYIPDEAKVFTSRPDMKKIAELIEAGSCDFAHFGERGESLRIK